MSNWKKLFHLSILMILFVALLGVLSGQSAKAGATAVPAGDWSKWIGGSFGQRQKIAMVSGSDGWLVQFDASNLAYLARYDGFNWNVPINGSAGHNQLIIAADLDMVSSNDGWLVLGGEIGASTAESSIYHWDGSNWNFVTRLTDANGVSLAAVEALSANNVWALGSGKFWTNLYHWDGSSWSFAGKTPGGVWTGHDLDMLSASNGWAVGMNGAIAHWDGSSWTAVPSSTSSTLNAIAMVDSNTGWAVGENGAIQAWGGTAWATYPSPTSATLWGIDMVSANEGWIVGDGVILYWDGSSWNNYTPPATDIFHDIDMITAKEGWVVGNNSLLQYEVEEPKLIMNFSNGAPGSYFNVVGQNFPPNETATISVNGAVIGSASVNGSGSFYFTLTTDSADEGVYFVTASVNPTATQQFRLDTADPVRAADNPADLYTVPAGIAFTQFLHLPAILR